MILTHNSHELKYRRPFGAAVCGAEVELTILISDPPCPCQCSLCVTNDKEGSFVIAMNPSETGGSSVLYSAKIKTPERATLLWYHFILSFQNGRTVYYGNNESLLGGIGKEYETKPPSYQITVYEKDNVPNWFTNGIAYQIFPDRFSRGSDWVSRQKDARRPENAKGGKRIVLQEWDDTPFYSKNPKGEVTRWPFFGGNLLGIIEKLPYLKELGISIIYLNPIFKATSNHKYDTADYMMIDESFGDEEMFKKLCREAENHGIRIILDGVFSHTGADSRYFNEFGNYDTYGACQGKDSPYYSWYRFNHYPDKYECWWGVGDLPNTEETDPSFSDFIYGGKNSVIRKWLRAGAKGWRLDVADELPDSFICGVRRAMLETDPDSLLMGEVWEDASNKRSYGVRREYFLGRELQSTMNYPFRTAAIDFMLGKTDASYFAAVLMSLKENYPKENFYAALNLIGSHDRERILTTLGESPTGLSAVEMEYYKLPEEKLSLARDRLKILSLLQFALPGVPCIYYGDEAGVQGYEDPYNRGTYPWGHEDKELLEHYKSISTLRRSHTSLTGGDFFAAGKTNHVLNVIRDDGREKLAVLINRGIFEWESVPVPEHGKIIYCVSPDGDEISYNSDTIILPPLSAAVIGF